MVARHVVQNRLVDWNSKEHLRVSLLRAQPPTFVDTRVAPAHGKTHEEHACHRRLIRGVSCGHPSNPPITIAWNVCNFDLFCNNLNSSEEQKYRWGAAYSPRGRRRYRSSAFGVQRSHRMSTGSCGGRPSTCIGKARASNIELRLQDSDSWKIMPQEM